MTTDQPPVEAPTPPPPRVFGRLAGSHLPRLFAGTLLAGLVSRALILGMTVVVARQLTPQGYGVFTFAAGTAALIAQFAGLGWPSLMSRLIPVFRVEGNWPALRALVRWGDGVVLLGALVAVVVVLAAAIMPGLDPDLQAGLALTLILIVPAALTLSRRTQLAGARRPAIGILFDEALPPAAVILVVLAGGFTTALPAVLAFGLAAALGAVLATAFFRRAVPPQTWQVAPAGEPRVWMRMALPLLLGSSATLIMNRMDILMLGPLGSLVEVGYFGIAFRITYLMTFPQVIMMQIVTPLLAESIAARGEPAMWRYFFIAVIFSLSTVIPLSLALCVFAEPIVTLVFGIEYAPAAGPLALLAISQAFAALAIPCTGLLIATGRGNAFGLINLVALLVNVALNFALIPGLGATGAALASMAGVVLMFTWQALTIWRSRTTITTTPGFTPKSNSDPTLRGPDSR